jgi:hypothetical protein
MPGLLVPLLRWWRQASNREYAQRCVLDSITRGEAPYASHIQYTTVLRDHVGGERSTGFECADAWGQAAHKRAVYCDFGITGGMQDSISRRPVGQRVEYRYLFRRDIPLCHKCACVLPPEVPRCPTCSTWQQSHEASQ